MRSFHASLIFTLAALAAVGFGVRLVEAQFVPPTQPPPAGNRPTVIYSVAPGATAQNADINITGAIKAGGCKGSTFVGLTASTYNGNRGGYLAADALCASFGAGAHVCRVEEILESIRCSTASDPIRNAQGSYPDGQGWLNGGPPGFTAEAKDCSGWQSENGAHYGRLWSFNNTTGGAGAMTTCNSLLKISCCR